MLRLANYRDRRPSVADYLPWAILAGDGIVQTKRMAFIAGFYFTPPDSSSSTDEITAGISDRVNEALLQMGTGWSTWTDAISVPAAPYPPVGASAFPDPVSRMVDEERRRAFNAEGAHFENERAFIVCYHPPHQSVSRMEALFYEDDGRRHDRAGILSRIEERFEDALRKFEAALGPLLGMRRMRSYTVTDPFGRKHQRDELVNYLHFCATGRPQEINIPAHETYIDCLVGSQELDPGDIPMIGEDWVQCVVIEGFPAASYPCILETLATLPMTYRFSQRMIYLDANDAAVMLRRYDKFWGQRTKNPVPAMLKMNPPPDAHALAMQDDARSLASLANSGDVRFGYYTATVVLRGRDIDVLREDCLTVLKIFAALGFSARIETINTVEAWRATLPGEIHAQVRRPPIHTWTLSDLLPLSGVWTGSATAPCDRYPLGAPALMHARTVGSIPFRANLHVGDVGHTLIFGPTGAGKSLLLNSIALQALRYRGMRITAFDNKRGMLVTANACGAAYYELGGDGSPQLCPLAALETDRDRAQAAEWIATCFELQTGHAPLPLQRTEIHNAIMQLSQQTEHRSLTDFCLAVQDIDVRDAMRFYTLDGPAGALLDGREEQISDRNFTVFETLDLMSMGEKTSLPTLLSLFRRFERTLDGKPSLLVIDEGWIVLASKVWSDKLVGWLKLLRSKNCAVVFATQSLSDAVRSGVLDVLLESCPTKVFLPNPEAYKQGTHSNPGPRDFYEAMGLNEAQIDIINNATQKRDYYWTSRLGCRLIELGVGPVQLAIAGATGEEQIEAVKKLIARHGKEWVWPYLDSKGVAYEHLL